MKEQIQIVKYYCDFCGNEVNEKDLITSLDEGYPEVYHVVVPTVKAGI